MHEHLNQALLERPVRCPYCDETIELVIDLSAGDQSYTEDCHVCCQPMQVSYSAEGMELSMLLVEQGG